MYSTLDVSLHWQSGWCFETVLLMIRVFFYFLCLTSIEMIVTIYNFIYIVSITFAIETNTMFPLYWITFWFVP